MNHPKLDSHHDERDLQPDPTFERELRDELQSFTVPAGFTDRLHFRLHQRAASRRNRLWQQAIAAAVLLTASVGGGVELHRRQQQREAAEAAAQFDLAMRITGHSLEAVNRAMNRLDKSHPDTNGDQQ